MLSERVMIIVERERMNPKLFMNEALAAQIRAYLWDNDKLLKQKPGNHGLSGHCYVASEVYYHLSGGKNSNLKPATVNHEGVVHWFLRDPAGNVIDLTGEQFKTRPAYKLGRGRGFLTSKPSKRAKKVIFAISNRRFPLP